MVLLRLDKIYKRISVLQTALFSLSEQFQFFIESKEKDMDTIIYGLESIEGTAEILNDIQQDILSLNGQLNEEDENILPETYSPDIGVN